MNENVSNQNMLWSERRSEVRNRSKVNKFARVSLQMFNILDMEKRLAGIAGSQNVRKNMKVNSLIHVLDELISLDW